MHKNIKDRLLERRVINDKTNCWLWTGTIVNHYGQIKINGKGIGVHRLALEIFKNEILGPNDQANHIKECPFKHCFNPDHLYRGDQCDNNRDKFNGKCKICGNSRKRNERCKHCKKVYMRKYMKKYYQEHK